jgi:uncharacterized protein
MVVAGKFEFYKDNAGKYRFRLKAGNGQIVAVGEAYESKAAAEKGITSVQENAPSATIDDQTDWRPVTRYNGLARSMSL